MSKRVVVVGSLNMDVSVRCARLPRPGETILADSVHRSGGGKGANQAVAAARAGGAQTAMVGAVGADEDGATLLADLARDGVDVTGVRRLRDLPTGVALITVDARAENTIVVAAGANGAVELTDEDRRTIGSADVVLAQLEVPQRVLADAAGCRRDGALFVLNAAPAAEVGRALLAHVDVLVVNEHEARAISGAPDMEEAIAALLAHVPVVVVTLGAAGARLVRGDGGDRGDRGDRGGGSGGDILVAAPAVSATDTVAAGDTFCGVFAAALADGLDDRGCLQRACAAASLAVQRPGAQASVPTRAETLAQEEAVYRAGRSAGLPAGLT